MKSFNPRYLCPMLKTAQKNIRHLTLEELEEYFETRQVLHAENTARDFGLSYFKCNSEAELLLSLPEFFHKPGAALLEIVTENLANAAVYKAFKNNFDSN